MNIEFEQYYCKSCCKLFNDIIRRLYYTRNNFIDNQIRLIYDMPYKHKMVQPNYHFQCPHCYSNKVVNVNDVLSGKLIIRSEKIAESNDKKMLKCLGEWLKFYNEITGYIVQKVSNGFALYTDDYTIKRKIDKLLSMKSKPLNTTNDK